MKTTTKIYQDLNLLVKSSIEATRPKQWTKNFLVFAAPLFSFQYDGGIWIASFQTLICFCLISSAIYLINDCLDIKSDRLHPVKKYRAIASGRLKVTYAIILALLLSSLSLYLSSLLSSSLTGIIFLYALIQTTYCVRLKHEPLLDLFCISSGFLLRAIAGGISSELTISPWFLLTVGLLALFLALEKRKAELRNSIKNGIITRSVLNRYSLPLLLRLESIVATSSFLTYALWAAGPSVEGAKTSWMLLTVPFVLTGIFRYQLLSDPTEANRRNASQKIETPENPEEILLKDKGIRLTLIGWILTTIIIGISTHI